MNHDTYSDAYIRSILSTVKTVAVVGASTNPARASNIVLKYLLAKRYRAYPVNPVYAGQEILGQLTYPSLADLSKPIDLAAAGQCPATRVLKVVNTETKKGETIIYDAMGQKFFIIPYEFNQYVVKYMEEKLRESKLTVDETTGKEIDVSIEKIKVELSAGGFAFWAWAELKISLAEINYTQIYFGNEGSGAANNAVAYAVHFAVQHFLEDPVVQKYFQCRN